MTAVEFRAVSKTFYRHSSRELLRHKMQRFAEPGRRQRFQALKEISFRIALGEGVGIIGANGAGKSTLLSLMTGLAQPDSGRILVHGRVGALLQLGAGFHLDLTGAENVRLNAALLGISRKRTAEIYESVVDFAGIGDFIGEPMRTYSSGMTMRLAFAVAVQMDPDILIVDEVLAVGDHEFQTKCRDKILEFKRSGRTMICVSHAGAVLEQFCDRALWLDRGELVMDGALGEVTAAYQGRT
jgi:ABC-type polysaccharide/polyol phosphate transport system ATPase subunit